MSCVGDSNRHVISDLYMKDYVLFALDAACYGTLALMICNEINEKQTIHTGDNNGTINDSSVKLHEGQPF